VGEMEEIIERGSDADFYLNFPKLKILNYQTSSKEAAFELEYI
jgi:hypothetical protein